MLKIYRRHIRYDLHNNDEVIHLDTFGSTVILDDSEAVAKTQTFGAYTDEATKAYSYYDLKQTRKGIKIIYWKWDGCAVLKQWIAPDAKLVNSVSYREYDCTMKELMTLPSSFVIAYLKQEGLNFPLTN